MRCKCGPWPRSVACALGVQSRENWQVTTGSASNHAEPTRPMETPISFFIFDIFRIFRQLLGVCSTPSHYPHHHQQKKPPPPSSPAREVAACYRCWCYPPSSKQDTPAPPPAPSFKDCFFLCCGISRLAYHKTRTVQ